ncbi:hypothetical protein CKA32_001052 [Geitlerinema sp. FC II]|nr:hypothetical protein CKA32_001052 [Geitlerinema sp. FC II]
MLSIFLNIQSSQKIKDIFQSLIFIIHSMIFMAFLRISK